MYTFAFNRGACLPLVFSLFTTPFALPLIRCIHLQINCTDGNSSASIIHSILITLVTIFVLYELHARIFAQVLVVLVVVMVLLLLLRHYCPRSLSHSFTKRTLPCYQMPNAKHNSLYVYLHG